MLWAEGKISVSGTRCLHSRSVRLHSRRSGEARRLRILWVLASSNVPLSVRELIQRTGLPRRTVYYYLAQLMDAEKWSGTPLVRRVGKARSPGVLYEVTRAGRDYLERSWSGIERCANTRRSGDGVRRGARGLVVGRLVVQERGDGGREVGVRVGFKVYRDVLASLGVPGFGVRAPRRVKYSMFYVDGRGEGTVHFDFYVRLDRFGAVSAGLWAVRGRVLAMVSVAFSLLKWYGYTESFVRELWRRVPRLVLEDEVYLEDGRGRRIGVWDPVAGAFVDLQPSLDVFLGG